MLNRRYRSPEYQNCESPFVCSSQTHLGPALKAEKNMQAHSYQHKNVGQHVLRDKIFQETGLAMM